jgi:hypothetical protein
MAESAAERQRRYRRHKKNDHSLCVEGRCDDVTPGVTRNAEPAEERGVQLEEAGQKLWDAVTGEMTLGPMQKVLLLEACRIADRLDRLDGQLRGGGEWLRLEADEDRDEVIVIVDKALAEARQQATALKGLVAELRQTSPVSKSTEGKPPAQSTTSAKGAANVSDIRARIAEKRASTSH